MRSPSGPSAKTTKATRVLNVGSLDTSVPPSWKYPEFPEVRTCFPRLPVATKLRHHMVCVGLHDLPDRWLCIECTEQWWSPSHMWLYWKRIESLVFCWQIIGQRSTLFNTRYTKNNRYFPEKEWGKLWDRARQTSVITGFHFAYWKMNLILFGHQTKIKLDFTITLSAWLNLLQRKNRFCCVVQNRI